MKASRFLAALTVACAVSIPAYANCHLATAPGKMPEDATGGTQQTSPDNQAGLHNVAADRLQLIAAEFNRQVIIFKSKRS